MKIRLEINVSILTHRILDELSYLENLPKGRIVDLIMGGENFDDVFFVFEVQYPVNPDSAVMSLPHYHGVVVQGIRNAQEFVQKTKENLQLRACTLDYSEAMELVNSY